MDRSYIELVHHLIDEKKIRAFVQKSEYGAIVEFLGVVRNHHQGKAVDDLEYSAYEEMAYQEIQSIIDQISGRYVSQMHIAVSHRLGRLAIGDCAIMVAVASAHRKEAFDVCHEIIDQIKEKVPIFKKEFYTQDQEKKSHWVGIDQK